MNLLGNDSDSEVDFSINEDYAKRYERWRRGEEIQKLKDKYGDVDDSSDSTSEEEDEDGKELTEDVEKQFYKTLSCLKEKNPKIYDKNIRFFDGNHENEQEIKKKDKKSEPSMSLADYQRKVLLDTGGVFSDNDEVDDKNFEMMSSQDQENEIKRSFKNVLKDSDDEDEEQWGNLFTKRIKTTEEIKKEEEDFRQWLAGEKKLENSNVREELKGLHDYWTDPKLDEGEKFLRDYVLNKRYLEKEDRERIPSYDEIVHDSDSNLSADDNTLVQQEEFEKKYNFRFEEPDREFIKRYPRTLAQSMRKKDDKRKIQREELKQRKQVERSKKDEELKRLKALKKKEIMDKIRKLQRITGNENIAFKTEDLEADFDPLEYDKRMSQIFNEDYYGTGGDDEYPKISESDDDLETENWDHWDGRNEQEEDEPHCEDPDFIMDCDYDPTKKKELQQEMIKNSRRRKNRKKSKFAESLERAKPVFDPKDKTFEQYVDEYYALDYEDLIGDLPCRFKYRKVVPNDYGLTIDEILNATDQELNRWVSIKKIRKRQPEHVEKYDVKAYKMKALNFQKKAKCFPSLYGPDASDWEQHEGEITRKNISAKNNFVLINETEPITTQMSNSVVENEPKKKKKKVKSNDESFALSERALVENETEFNSPVVEEKSVGADKKNKKLKRRIGEAGSSLDEDEALKAVTPLNDAVISDKKKKKRKIDNWITESVENDEPLFKVDDIHKDSGTGKKKKRRKKSKGDKVQNDSHDLKQISVPRKGKKRKHSATENNGGQNWNNKQGKRKKRKMSNQKDNKLCSLSDERLRSYGLNPKKYKNKLKYSNKNIQNS